MNGRDSAPQSCNSTPTLFKAERLRGKPAQLRSISSSGMAPISQRQRVLSLLLPLLVILLACSPAAAAPADSKPSLTHTLFDNLPAKIFYFDDTPVSSRYVELEGARTGASAAARRRGGVRSLEEGWFKCWKGANRELGGGVRTALLSCGVSCAPAPELESCGACDRWNSSSGNWARWREAYTSRNAAWPGLCSDATAGLARAHSKGAISSCSQFRSIAGGWTCTGEEGEPKGLWRSCRRLRQRDLSLELEPVGEG